MASRGDLRLRVRVRGIGLRLKGLGYGLGRTALSSHSIFYSIVGQIAMTSHGQMSDQELPLRNSGT